MQWDTNDPEPPPCQITNRDQLMLDRFKRLIGQLERGEEIDKEYVLYGRTNRKRAETV